MAGMLDGKSALITGGGGGIGRATALAFAREGARVAVADLMAEAARETVAQVNASGGQAISLSGDVSRDADVRAMIDAVVGTYGRLDCAFNNAGIAGWQVDAILKKTAEWSEEAFDRMIAVNLKGVWLCMRHELPQMQAQGGGAIVNTGSIAGLVGLPNSSAYVAAKHGVLGLTRVTALETAEDGITCNAICPGYVRTPLVEKQIDDQAKAHGIPRDQVINDVLLKNQPNKRFVEVAELAALALFLCSDNGASVTGAALPMDGGWTAH